MLYSLGERRIELRGDGHWIAPNATLVGDIVLEAEVSVWWGAVLRADNDSMHIGAATNIQDGAILHVDPGYPMTIGQRVSVGHRVMLHGCHIGDGSLIGIGATLLNGARIGKHCVIGAHALVTEGKEIPDRSLVVGVPGKVVREVTDEDVAWLESSARDYQAHAREYRAEMRPQE